MSITMNFKSAKYGVEFGFGNLEGLDMNSVKELGNKVGQLADTVVDVLLPEMKKTQAKGPFGMMNHIEPGYTDRLALALCVAAAGERAVNEFNRMVQEVSNEAGTD